MAVAKTIDYGLLTNCVVLWVTLYGAFIILVDYNYMYIIGTALLYIILHILLLPPPDENLVKEVLGVNPRERLRLLSDALFSDESTTQEANEKLSQGLFSAENMYQSIAHQAAGLDAPQNTMAAIKMCSKKGCKFIHIDVRLTSDNIAVLFSDEKLNQKWMEGVTFLENNIEDTNWQDVKDAGISRQFPLHENFEDETIPTLEDAVSLCLELNMRVVINLVHSNHFHQLDAMIQILLNMYETHPYLYKKAIISSFNPLILYMIRKRKPEIIVALCWKPFHYYNMESYSGSISWLNVGRYKGPVQRILAKILDFLSLWLITNIVYRILNISCIILHKDIITPRLVEQWENKGIRVIASVVNLAIEKAYYREAIGISYLTDTLDN